MRILVFFTVLALCLGGQLGAQQPKAGQKAAASQTGTDKASASRGKADSQDPNIKHGSEVNPPNANLPAPPAKGGSARAGVCQIHVDNRTSLYIKVYVDGDYEGVVSPWGDGITYALSGATRLYGRADFTDGTYSSFGPRVIDCQGTFTWTLTP